MTALLPPLLLALAAASEPPYPVPAEVLSAGAGRPVTARLSYDPRKAADDGVILAAARLGADQAESARLAEGFLTSESSYFGPAALAARRRAVPAISLPRALWEDGALSVPVPSYAPAVRGKGFGYRLPAGQAWRRLGEGEVVTVDPRRGVLRLHPPEEQEFELSLAGALRAYEGLRDARALAQWHAGWSEPLEGRPPRARRAGARLLDELAERLAEGAAAPADFAAVRAAVLGRLSEAEKGELAAALRRRLARQGRAASASFLELEQALARAATRGAAERVGEEAGAVWNGLSALAAALGAPPPREARERWERVSRLSAAAARRLPEAGGPEQAARAAGAEAVERAFLAPELYERFVAEARLAARLEEAADDVSQDLVRRSRRIRAAIAAAPLAAESELGADILRRAPGHGPFVVSSETGARRAAPGGAALLAAVREAWADSWEPGPLGARKRGGRGNAPRPEVAVERLVPADASGVALSRDPAGGGRARVAVSAVFGRIEGLTAGQPADQYLLDAAGAELSAAVADKRRRVAVDAGTLKTELVPPGLSLRRALTAEQLARVALLARALDAELGRGVEVEFAFAGERLLWLGARALPQPLRLDASANAEPAAPPR